MTECRGAKTPVDPTAVTADNERECHGRTGLLRNFVVAFSLVRLKSSTTLKFNQNFRKLVKSFRA